MAWSNPRTWVDGELVTASLLNSSVRDLFNELWKYANKGGIVAAQSATVIAEVAPVSNGQSLVADSTQATGVKWSSGPLVPIGGIILWSGSSGSIPSGWALCDGSNGTPNLRDRFIVGAGSTYAVGATGGSTSATVSHSHNFSGNTGGRIDNGVGANTLTGGFSDHYHTYSGTSSTTNSSISTLPPYYSLCYIMRVS